MFDERDVSMMLRKRTSTIEWLSKITQRTMHQELASTDCDAIGCPKHEGVGITGESKKEMEIWS